MERQVLRSLIVFLERVQFLFSSLFAEILISTLYYSRRTPPLLHLLCVIRPHLLLSAFHYVFFFVLIFGFRIVFPFCPSREIVSVVLNFVNGSRGEGVWAPFEHYLYLVTRLTRHIKLMVTELHCEPSATEVFRVSVCRIQKRLFCVPLLWFSQLSARNGWLLGTQS